MSVPTSRDGKPGLPGAVRSAPRSGESAAENMVRSIEQFLTNVLGEQLNAMLDGADDILFEMAEKAPTNSEQRLYFDTLRIIRLERPRLMRTFQDNLKQSLADGRLERAASNIDVDDLDSWSVQGKEDTEESVTVANLESKVSQMYHQELFELENRLESLSESTHEQVSPAIASPKRIFDAFRYTMKGLDVEFPVKQVIYRLAERALIGNLKDVYVGANRMLAARGYEPRKGVRPPAQRGGPESPGVPTGAENTLPRHDGPANLDAGLAAVVNTPPPPYMQATGPSAWPSGLPASRLLEGLARTAGAAMPQQADYSDSQLAGEMASALDALSRGRPFDSWMPAPNLSLAGRMFDSLYQDRHLSEACKPLLQRLQYPVMKTALADPQFFESPDHPVRKLVHEVFDMLLGAGNPTPEDIDRLSGLIEHLIGSVEVDVNRLRDPAARAPAVDDAAAEAFLADQESKLAAHRQRTVERVRRLVAQELQLRTAARNFPDSLRPLLLSGFAPLLAVNVLQGGMDGIPWQESLKLLDRVLDSLEGGQRIPEDRRRALENQIAADVYIRLTDVGLAPEKVERLITSLGETYRALAAQPPVRAPVAPAPAPAAAAARAPAPAAMPAPAPAAAATSVPPAAARPAQAAPAPNAEARQRATANQALSAILTVGSWFQVWDSSHQLKRWLKLHAYFPGQDIILFDDFLGENHLRIRATTFTHDLLAKRSAPVDPNPAVQRSMELLAPLAADLPANPDPPVWQPAAGEGAAVH